MKVVLSIDSVRFPLTGIGRYTFELAKQLEQLPQIEQLYLLSRRQIVADIPVPTISFSQKNAGTVRLQNAILKNPAITEIYRWLNSKANMLALRNYADCVFHGPNFYLPPFGGAAVSSIHDLSVFTWAQCHPPERVSFMRKEIEQTLKRADRLIADSEFNRKEIADYFAWPLEKIHAVPLACAEEFRPRGAEELVPVLQKYSLRPAGYSLFVGTIEPRKNIESLLDAYSMLPMQLRRNWPLVLSGHHGWRSEKLHDRINVAMTEGWVRYLGFVSTDELPLLYSGARLFIFPSLYEGFGLPILEAMASGIPVVCSDSACLPEVADGAAAMCAAKDVDALCNLIQAGLDDEVWRSEAMQKGLVQASRYSWKRCAEETVDVYRALV